MDKVGIIRLSLGERCNRLGDIVRWVIADVFASTWGVHHTACPDRSGVLLAVFTFGYVCGLVSVRPAVAQLPQLPGVGGQAGGTLTAVSQLGTSITDMEQNVNNLQKNLDILKKVQSALGGK